MNDAEVWLLPEADVDDWGRRGEAMLSADERARCSRLLTASARRRCVGARLLSRSVLAERVGTDPARLSFTVGAFGRPELRPNPWRLRFNLTHSEGLIACAVTADLPCGIDAERTPAAADLVRYGAERFAPAERARLDALGSGASTAFVDMWVLKEAYTKALGLGFQYRFDGFSLMADSRGAVALDDPRVPEAEAARWAFSLATMPTGHRLALAVRYRTALHERARVPVRAFPDGSVLSLL